MTRSKRIGSLSELPKRVATALAYGIVMLAAVLFGGPLGLGIVLGLAAALAAGELYAMTRGARRLPNEVFGVAAAAAMPVAAALGGTTGLNSVLTILVVAALGWHLMFRQVRLADTATTLFGALYVGFTLSHLVLMRALDGGTVFVLATLFSVWLADIAAYFVGSSLGRNRMAPRISPNKTWEGFVAGVLSGVGVWMAVSFASDSGLTFTWHIIIGVAVSVSAVVGDLVESRLKREVGVKDSGRSLPGHGGFLDRFDALILVSVVAYYLLVWAGATS